MATGYENLISGSTSTSSTTTSSTTSSSSSSLSKDDFLQLLLTELQSQDPTDPMDSDKILTQTSQLANLEASENTTAALEDLSSKLQSSTAFSATSTIGKMASLGSNYISYSGTAVTYEMYFPSEISDGTITIKDSDKNTIRTIDLGDVAAGKSGVVSLTWDGKDSEGNLVESGNYSISATYVDTDGTSKDTMVGVYPVESVYYEDGTTYLKLGSQYYPVDSVVEYYELTDS
jgi:flagellar basal-body rod modification protein FlgD